MSAVDVLSRISSTHLLEADLRYCLVSDDKRPYKIDDTMAKPNQMSDFVDFESLLQHTSLESYAGVGISIQASNIFAIDVDHCFETAFDVMSGDNRAKDLLERFADYAYCEFSFSGKGLRILFRHKVMDDYSVKYYIKNERHGIEFYQPSRSFRYVTVTGMTISVNNSTFKKIITSICSYIICKLLASKMYKRPIAIPIIRCNDFCIVAKF